MSVFFIVFKNSYRTEILYHQTSYYQITRRIFGVINKSMVSKNILKHFKYLTIPLNLLNPLFLNVYTFVINICVQCVQDSDLFLFCSFFLLNVINFVAVRVQKIYGDNVCL